MESERRYKKRAWNPIGRIAALAFVGVVAGAVVVGITTGSFEFAAAFFSVATVLLIVKDLGLGYLSRGATVDWAFAHVRDPSGRARARAAAALGKHRFGTDEGRLVEAIDALLRLSADPVQRVQIIALQALWRHSRKLPESRHGAVLDAVLGAIGSDDERIAGMGTEALRELLPQTPPERRIEVFALLWGMASDADPGEQSAGVLLMGEFADAVPLEMCGPLADKLTALCGDKNTHVRRRAAQALGLLGPRIPKGRERAALTALESLTSDGGIFVGWRAVEAIAEWGAQEEGPLLAEAMGWVASIADGRRRGPRGEAAAALLYFGAKLPLETRAARTEALIKRLRSDNRDTLSLGLHEARSMGAVVPDERRAEVEALLGAVRDGAGTKRLRAYAAQSLERFQAKERPSKKRVTLLDLASR